MSCWGVFEAENNFVKTKEVEDQLQESTTVGEHLRNR